MFAILPQTEGFVWEDADFFSNLDSATDSAFNWSEELNGKPVQIYEESINGYNPVRVVWS